MAAIPTIARILNSTILPLALSLMSVQVFSSQSAHALPIVSPDFYSARGNEHVISFDGVLRSNFHDLDEVNRLSAEERQDYLRHTIKPLMAFLFGPSTNRAIGGPKRDEFMEVHWTQSYLTEDKVMIPYTYHGLWIVDQALAQNGGFSLPVPFDKEELFSPMWKKCTDSAPEHATESFYWYFWDPARPGCDHLEGKEFQTVSVLLASQTPSQSISYPEYDRMIRNINGRRSLEMTIAFGYVEDLSQPNPEQDPDAGANEYRKFIQAIRGWTRWNETPISLTEYLTGYGQQIVVGHRFQAYVNGVDITVKVVINAGIDQMELFAKSFAHDHDAFFTWMGHSRVGSGFDADVFRSMIESHPDYYSITEDYQLIYWGGCNSYSYYALPFFQFKSTPIDTAGTRNLDILANGLPSLFLLGSINAQIVTAAILNWPAHTSYQSIVGALEQNASRFGTKILAVILGDEDNEAR